MSKTKRLEPPYGVCQEGISDVVYKGVGGKQVSYTQETCIYVCRLNISVDICKCKVTSEYIGATDAYLDPDIPFCLSLNTTHNELNRRMNCSYTFGDTLTEKCYSQCPYKCEETYYTTTSSSGLLETSSLPFYYR